MLDWLTVLLLGLATWRVSSLLVNEDGPWRVFRRMRRLARAGEWSQAGLDAGRLSSDEVEWVMMQAGRPEGFFSGLLSCIWCVSVWVSALVVIMWLIWPHLAITACLVLAISAMAILIERVI